MTALTAKFQAGLLRVRVVCTCFHVHAVLAVHAEGVPSAPAAPCCTLQADLLRREYAIDLRVLGITSSRRMLLREKGVDLSSWRQQLAEQGQAADTEAFVAALTTSYIPNCVVIDCTASDGPPQNYRAWMERGAHVITPNKKLGSGPLGQYQAVKRLGRDSYTHFFYEVGGCGARALKHPFVG